MEYQINGLKIKADEFEFKNLSPLQVEALEIIHPSKVILEEVAKAWTHLQFSEIKWYYLSRFDCLGVFEKACVTLIEETLSNPAPYNLMENMVLYRDLRKEVIYKLEHLNYMIEKGLA